MTVEELEKRVAELEDVVMSLLQLVLLDDNLTEADIQRGRELAAKYGW